VDFFVYSEVIVTMRYSFSAALLTAIVSASAFAGAGDELISQGESQLQAGQIEEAIGTLHQAVSADPGSSLAYTRLGGAQVLHQEYDAGIESFKQAIKLDGNNANAFVGMAVAYLHTDRDALARAALEEAKRIDPSKQAKVDELIALIDERASGSEH
jgi:tetratricopeptide (TPR) repeat protein